MVEVNGALTAIEYQGEQHFKPCGFGGNNAQQLWAKTKESDRIKREWCCANNVILMEITYLQFDDIEKIIIDLLK